MRGGFSSGHINLLRKAQSLFPAQDPYVSPAAWFNGCMPFFSLFTVPIRARPGGSVCVLHVGVSEQALHRDAHSPGKDLLQQLPSATPQVTMPCLGHASMGQMSCAMALGLCREQ